MGSTERLHCVDRCPLDPNNAGQGHCGCADNPRSLKAAGTACNDPACPQQGSTCNGAGVCGDRAACSPCAGGKMIIAASGWPLWLCGGPLPAVKGPGCVDETPTTGATATRADAQKACRSKGLVLAQLDSISEQRALAPLLTTPHWIGANDLDTPGKWYWPSSTSESGTLIWTGDASGAAAPGVYTNWDAGSPSSSCAAVSVSPITDQPPWTTLDCNQKLGYLCEYPHDTGTQAF